MTDAGLTPVPWQKEEIKRVPIPEEFGIKNGWVDFIIQIPVGQALETRKVLLSGETQVSPSDIDKKGQPRTVRMDMGKSGDFSIANVIAHIKAWSLANPKDPEKMWPLTEQTIKEMRNESFYEWLLKQVNEITKKKKP